ncbi:MAG: outer membrane beta-barrel protein [Akkermansiaceae bacterium]|nr:outer membrane beta-barrel protein [Verrucomicrobiales bacterium]
MNKIVASFGIAALGASTIPSASAQDLQSAHGKPWAVSATLRGFYDDNINGAPSGPNKVESTGFEISPGIGLNIERDQTSIALGYRYSLRYYDKNRFSVMVDHDNDDFTPMVERNSGHDSHTHSFDGSIHHSFTERYSISLRDSFVVGQEPDLLRGKEGGGANLTPVPGDNIRNYGSIAFNAVLTPVLDLEVGYNNQWFDYDNSGTNNNGLFQQSLSGSLDRIEQTAHVETLWRFLPSTQAIFGYQFGMVNHTGDEALTQDDTKEFQESSDRDTRSHYLYTGLTHVFRPDLNGSIRVGGRFTDFYNVDRDEMTPYARASLKYIYAPESFLEGGASYDLSAATRADAATAETANLFVSLRHRIVPKLFGSVTGQIQNLNYIGGDNDGENTLVYTTGINLEYFILPYLSTHIGYNYDAVNTDVENSDYSRNRVYIGVTATY